MKTLSRLIICCVVGVITVAGSVCVANNNLFLPGDAFFPTELTKADVEELQTVKTGDRKFLYSNYSNAGFGCGFAGYSHAVIPGVDDQFAKNLASVYSIIRESEKRELIETKTDGKTELVETNGIRVLFYPPNFKFPKHRLGLRYNENWVAETVKFGHDRNHVRLCCLISDQDAVSQSWRDAELIPGLTVQLPDVPLKPVPKTKSPVVVRGPVKAIVIGSNTLKDLFQYNPDDYLTIYVVDSKGITELVYENGKWASAVPA